MSGPRVQGEMGLNITPFQQSLDKAKGSLNAFATGQLGSIKGMLAGAFTVGAVTALASEAIALGGKFDDLSKRTGVSAEELQRLDYAAKQNGSSIEALAGGLQKLAVARQNALGDTGGEAAKAFEDLGISIKDVASLSPEQLFYRIADAVKNQGAAVNNAASMTALLGRGFGEIVPMMVDGGDGLRAMADEATRLGVVLSTDTISKLDSLGDKLTALKAQSISFAATFGINVASGFEALIEETSMKILSLSGLSKEAYKDAWMAHQEVMALIGTQNLGLTPAKGRAGMSSVIGETDSERKSRANAEASAMEAQLREEERINKERSAVESYNMEHRLKEEEAAAAREGELAMERIRDAQALEEIKSGKGMSVSAPISDNLARIGGYVGAQGTPALRVAERQEKIQQKMAEYLKKIAERDFAQGTIPDATPR